MELEIIDLGLAEYENALEIQLKKLEEIYLAQSPGALIVCSHPPVVTKGVKTVEGDIFAWPGKIIAIKRGGRATYHGPSQTIVYPLINLQYPRTNKPRRDIGWLLRTLEEAMIETLAEFQIKAHGKTTKDDTGVWVDGKKIASIGIAVTRWISYHGLALNVFHDPQAFQGINPCGYQSSIMTSMEQVLGQKPNQSLVKERLLHQLKRRLI